MEKESWKTLVDFKRITSCSMIEKEQKFIIEKITKEEIIADKGRKETVPLCYFKGEKMPMVLNKTNFKTLEKLFNSDKYSDWYGKEVIVFVQDGITFGKEIVSGLRIKNYIPTPPKIIKCADCSNDITATDKMTVEGIAAYSKKMFGVECCVECGKIRRDKEKNNAK